MSASVLFDAPGPKTIARHRLYSVVSGVVLLALMAWLVKSLADDGQFEYAKWEPFVTPEYMQVILVDGLLETLKMAGAAILLAIALGTLLGVGKLSDRWWVSWPAAAVVEFFRATPVLLLMMFLWFWFGIETENSGFKAVVVALMVYNGAVLAEVLRAGINAVPRGQSEAAYALGMRKTQVMRAVLVPQGVKIMFPSIVSQCIVALKDTALGYAVLAPGLMAIGKQIYNDPQFGNNRVPTMFVIAAIYITVNLLLMLLAHWLQKKYVGEKKLEVGMVGERDQQVPIA